MGELMNPLQNGCKVIRAHRVQKLPYAIFQDVAGVKKSLFLVRKLGKHPLPGLLGDSTYPVGGEGFVSKEVVGHLPVIQRCRQAEQKRSLSGECKVPPCAAISEPHGS